MTTNATWVCVKKIPVELNAFCFSYDRRKNNIAVQQLKTLLRAETKSHFCHTRADTILHFDRPIRIEKRKNCDL